MKKISIIVPLYNNEKYILDCIKSIENQDYKHKELIIVNDGSTDKSLSIIRNYQFCNDLEVKIISQENLGQGVARNTGLSHSTGDYICFVDSDDFISEKMFSIMIEYIENHNLDVIQCRYMNWYGENSSKNSVFKTNISPHYITTGNEFYDNYPSLSPCDKIYKKDFLDRIGFHFTTGRYAEDVYDISIIHYYANKMELLDNVFYFYRRVNQNSTRNVANKNREIKLCKDKLYIASRLYLFKKSKNWNGYVDTIIFRNIIGILFKKIYYSKEYHKILVNYSKELKIKEILKRVVSLNTFINSIKIGYNKFINHSD